MSHNRERVRARQSAKALLRAAEAGDRDAAVVLVDALIHAGHADAAESLSFALAGRAYSELGPDVTTIGARGIKRGGRLPPQFHEDNLRWAIDLARRTLFPVRRLPCMPNEAALRAFAREAALTRFVGADARELLRSLRATLRGACARPAAFGRGSWALGRRIEAALDIANEIVRGDGVVRAFYLDMDGNEVAYDYVEGMIGTTLLYDHGADRFRVAFPDGTWHGGG